MLHYRFSRLWILALFFLCICCGKNEVITVIDEEEPPKPIELIRVSLSGVVQDEQGIPLQEARVSIYNSSAQTDPNGYFTLKEVLAPKDGAPVIVSHNGYINSYSLITSEPTANNYQAINLAPLKNNFQFNTDDGFEWVSPEGIEIKIPPMAVLNEEGLFETGLVNISIHWNQAENINSGAEAFQIFRATNKQKEEVAIQHAGILQLAIQNVLGEELDAKEVHIVIPSSELSNSNIALDKLSSWTMDLTRGQWDEGHELSTNNQSIKTTLSQGRLWSIGAASNSVTIQGNLFFKNSQGEIRSFPFQGFKLISQDSGQDPIQLFSDDRGRFSFFTHTNTNYKIEVPSLCNQNLEVISPTDWVSPAGLSSIQLSSDGNRNWIRKRFTDCDGNAITEGYLLLKDDQAGDQLIPLNPSEDGTLYVPLCTSSGITFDLYDQTRNKIWTNLAPSLVLNTVQSVTRLCDTVPTYFNLQIDGQEFSFFRCQASFVADPQNTNQQLIRLRAFNSPFTTNSDIVELWVEGTQSGVFDIRSITLKLRTFNNSVIDINKDRIEAQANIISLGDKNQGIEGNLEGPIRPIGLGTLAMTAQFNALRIN